MSFHSPAPTRGFRRATEKGEPVAIRVSGIIALHFAQHALQFDHFGCFPVACVAECGANQCKCRFSLMVSHFTKSDSAPSAGQITPIGPFITIEREDELVPLAVLKEINQPLCSREHWVFERSIACEEENARKTYDPAGGYVGPISPVSLHIPVPASSHLP